MRKTIMLAFATLIFAFAAFVTDLIRVDAGPGGVVTSPVAQFQATGVAKIKSFDSI